jgi:hypothetical protein
MEDVIRRIENLDAESELRCLEAFLLLLTVGARMLLSKNADPDTRLRILIQTNEINHHVLNRIGALRGGDSFFTASYTWRAVEGHFGGAPGLKEWVSNSMVATLDKCAAAEPGRVPWPTGL